jgi:SAM-dependent methyltransferase
MRVPPTDYEKMAARYDKGRTGPPSTVSQWRAVLESYLRGVRMPLLDLGSGTGWWAVTLSDWFGIEVVGLEPSPAMLGRAIAARRHARVRYVQGVGENPPLRDACCSAAWISTVVHHLSDVHKCAVELRRVLESGGPVLVRSAFSGRTEGVPWLHFFPEARPAAEARWPTVEDTVEAFEAAGFSLDRLATVEEETAPNLSAYAERIEVKADSTLAALDDRTFEAGMERIRRSARELDPEPVKTRLDLLVLR